MMDVLTLSRIQFALTSAFHYIYPPLSIGIGLMLVIMEGIYLKTKDPLYLQLTKFWVKIFALTFALGVATGLVQLFGFGTNWARYSRYVGDVFGGALGAEGIFAFFLEAGFLGIMLFGWDKVSPVKHYISTILVTLGAHFSAIWIVVANSWMQTPAGFEIVASGNEKKAIVTDFWQMVFNPSSVDRLTHVILGCWITGVFLLLSIHAYYYLKNRHMEIARRGMKMGLLAALAILLMQLVSADETARGVAVNQPAKLAAMEGIYRTNPEGEGTGITAIGYVDTKNEKVIGITIPKVLSMLVYRDLKKPVQGLDKIPRDEWPNVQAVFQAYHIMIAMWGAMFGLTLLSLYLFIKGKLEKAKWVLYALIVSVVFPQIANFTGWMTAEMGRQPWVVWHQLRTADGVSQLLKRDQVLGSIMMFILIYVLLFSLFIFLLNNKIQHGLDDDDAYVYNNKNGGSV